MLIKALSNFTLTYCYRINDDVLKQLYVVTISRILDNMIESSPDELDSDNLTVFDSKNIPPISIQDYLLRIMTYSRATSRNMVMSLSYIDILRNEKSSKFQLSRFNVHRLLVTSLMVASKFYEDLYIDNDSWATIAGVNLQELNRLERHFLAYIDFEINTKHD